MFSIPYSDGLEFLAHYLQQLTMESFGKERDLSGQIVNQGTSVFGNNASKA